MSEDSWVVLELTSKSEGEDPDIIKASIRHVLRGAEIFIPASVVERGQVREFSYLVDGYAFVKHRFPDSHYQRLEDTKYVQNPLYQYTGRREKRLATITSDQIDKLRSQVVKEVDQGIEVGDTVMIISGAYKHIRALVCEEIPEQDAVVVHIVLRSTDRLVTLPRAFLRLEVKSPLAPFREALRQQSAWASAVLKLFAMDESRADVLHELEAEREQLDQWVQSYGSLDSTLNAVARQPDAATVLQRFGSYLLLDRLAMSYRETHAAVANLASKQPKLNFVVDGTQLYVRCAMSPGLGKLTDKDGHRTGPIVGFLRSLAAIKKRHPESNFYVTWDGHSGRRKEMFSGYKSHRPARSETVPFGVEWLMKALPRLGIRQAFNPAEEADDVMASLVRGQLRESSNIVITTDRDLLQLVSTSTFQLCPAVGGTKEKLYDPATVESEYGVVPSAMVQLRALSGDASDHIPGTPGFGLKVAARVVKVYGTVSALFKSNLAGMTPKQAKSLRASEGQVRLNLELMTLRDVKYTEIDAKPDRQEAERQLKGISVRSDALLAAFFPN